MSMTDKARPDARLRDLLGKHDSVMVCGHRRVHERHETISPLCGGLGFEEKECHVVHFAMDAVSCIRDAADHVKSKLDEERRAAEGKPLRVVFGYVYPHIPRLREIIPALRPLSQPGEKTLWDIWVPGRFADLSGVTQAIGASARVDLEDADVWKPGSSFLAQFDDIASEVRQAVRVAVGEHAQLARMLFEAMRDGTLASTAKPDALLYVWPQLVSGPIRPPFQATGTEIRQDPGLLSLCRLMSNMDDKDDRPVGATWEELSQPERDSCLLLASTGFIKTDADDRIVYRSPLVEHWAGRYFSGQPVQRRFSFQNGKLTPACG